MQIEFVLFVLSQALANTEDLVMLARTHSTPLEKYTGYIDCAILHFTVPQDVNFACFKFQAEEIELSLFRCHSHDVTVYLKQGSPPVINPDGSIFPKGFFNFSRPIEKIEFQSNNTHNYINISSPTAGSYFAAAFISYTDPKLRGITQQGLTPNCLTTLNVALLVNQKPKPYIAVPDRDLHLLLQSKTNRIYKFYLPDFADYAILNIRKIQFCRSCSEIIVKILPHRIPTSNEALYEIHLKREEYNEKMFMLRFMTLEDSWYYIKFYVNTTNDTTVTNNERTEFLFKMQYFTTLVNVSSDELEDINRDIRSEALSENGIATLFQVRTNNSIHYKHSILRNYQSEYLDFNVTYKQYNLVRDGHTESFLYSFDLHPGEDGLIPLAVNMTSEDITVLKFHVNSGIDIGGTLQFGLAFRPRFKTEGTQTQLENEPENHTVIACLKNNEKVIPTWPNKCTFSEKEDLAPIILNKTVKNSTIFIAFPEPGNWYASFKLFCGECKECKCSKYCREKYKNCCKQCEMHCETSQSCNSCIEECEKSTLTKKECSNCNCDGPCQKNAVPCNTSILFAIASYPCVSGKCGPNGRCMYMISEGLAYSLCVCSNNYKGWDCTDDSAANSNAMIILELLLLVLSNLVFLPAAYIAYKREYYVEAIVYFATCFFSTFYHSCDAGENIYSFCIVRLSVLQFSDFFCGLLSIWVTIIAIAYLPNQWPSIFHITGAILLAFGTTINKTALWAFTVPFITGTVILIISWYRNYKKNGVRFPSKRYLYIYFPLGILIVAVGLLMYALLQTNSNYKYLHSMWHVLMAVSIMILLPNKKTFLPPAVQPIQ